MSQDNRGEKSDHRDFFISYTGCDRQWAEWIAFQLEEAGYTLFIQAWDFRPGSNFVAEMDRAAKFAERTLLVLSPAYLESDSAFAEWAAAFRYDPKGTGWKLLPVRIEPYEVDGLLGSIVFIDLISLEEMQARSRLLAGVQQERAKPATVAFPGPPREAPAVVPFPGSLPAHWNLPVARNPFFTGREDLLERLHTQLNTMQKAVAIGQPQAISGLGGIGKTQLAIEYAYCFRHEYQAILWARAETTEALNASYAEIARILNLPKKNVQEQEVIVQAVKHWLQETNGWLLILDNADDLIIVQPFLPLVCPGHLVLTTQARVMGKLARRLEIDTLEREVGALLLLRRAGVITPDGALDSASSPDHAVALKLTEEFEGLPLALDQAGAYIEETQCGLADYERQYQTRRGELLAHRGMGMDDHPAPVTATWSISFAKVESRNPAAADLLRLCAFLAPEAIPEKLLTEGAKELGEVLAPIATKAYQFQQAIDVLHNYSLIKRDSRTSTLTVHRLVQAVLRNSLSVEDQQKWKLRAVRVVRATLPNLDHSDWTTCEVWLPHVSLCDSWMKEEEVPFSLASPLLNWAGCYLRERARYDEAESFLEHALTMSQFAHREASLAETTHLNELAYLYWNQGKYKEAEKLFKRARIIQEGQMTYEALTLPEKLQYAESLQSLACVYQTLGKYKESEELFLLALKAVSLQSLAFVYQIMGRHKESEELFLRALARSEPADELAGAVTLSNLAELYRRQGRYKEADLLLKHAQSIHENHVGSEHLKTAYIFHKQALLSFDQERYDEAEKLFIRTQKIYETRLGSEHPNRAQVLHGLAEIRRVQHKHEDAEALFKHALKILKKKFGPEHPATASTMNGLALLYLEQGKYIYMNQERCMKQGRYKEAEELFDHALKIRERCLGEAHPDTALSLHNFALFCYAQEEYEKAEKYFQRALRIWCQQLHPEHPYIVHARCHLALIHHVQGRDDLISYY